MFHKAIETKKDGVKFLRSVEPVDVLERLDQLALIVNGKNSEIPVKDSE